MHTLTPPATDVHTSQLSVRHNSFNGNLSTITPLHVTHLPPTNTYTLTDTWWLEGTFHFVVLGCVCECVGLMLCDMFSFSVCLFECTVRFDVCALLEAILVLGWPSISLHAYFFYVCCAYERARVRHSFFEMHQKD